MTTEVTSTLALLISFAAIVVSIVNFAAARRTTIYQDMDRLYFELLKLAMQYPQFVNAEKTQKYDTEFQGDERIKYELFAYTHWNVVECIYDRKNYGSLWKTWKTALLTADELHGTYFRNPNRIGKFKKSFEEYIKSGAFKEDITDESVESEDFRTAR